MTFFCWRNKIGKYFFHQIKCLNFTTHTRTSTIYALSSGQGKCGVAVIRVSGPQAASAATTIADMKSLPPPRQAILRKFKDPLTHDILDKGLLIWFPGPKSFTGEDSCEFQVHGGPAVISSLLAALGKLKGFRPAEAGEFTRRAFHAGKLDLTAVEGLADLIDAETDAQRKQALLQAEGALSHLYNDWRETIIKSIGYVEAYIDFSEDENIEDDVLDRVETMVRCLLASIQHHLDASRCGERLRSGVRTAIVGEPNVGKSTLLNTLCSRPAAIVSPTPGTTRDVLELHLSVGGYPVVVSDTAGLRINPSDSVEREGITRAVAQVRKSDLVMFVVDALAYVSSRTGTSLACYLRDSLRDLDIGDVLIDGTRSCITVVYRENATCTETKCLIVLNKTDLLENNDILKPVCERYSNVVAVSCKTEDGIPQLLDKFTHNLELLCGNPVRESPSFSQARHRHLVTACATSLQGYLALQTDDIVLAAHHLRQAVRHIAGITGHVSSERILDVIFRDFCIGK